MEDFFGFGKPTVADAIFDGFRKEYEHDMGAISKTAIGLDRELCNLPDKDASKAMKAVNLSLVDLAIADSKAFHGDGFSASVMFDRAMMARVAAQQLGVNTADIKRIEDRISDKIRPAVEQQHKYGQLDDVLYRSCGIKK